MKSSSWNGIKRFGQAGRVLAAATIADEESPRPKFGLAPR